MKFLFFVLLLTYNINGDDSDLDSEQFFQETPIEEMHENQYEDTQCNKDILLNFNLKGHLSVQQETNYFCPYINLNCCTDIDQNYSMFIWNTQQKQIFEKNIVRYKRSVKYLFGFVEQVHSLAKSSQDSKDNECIDAVQTIKNLKLTPSLITEITEQVFEIKEQMSSLRKGFKCVLCDGKTYIDQEIDQNQNQNIQKIKISMDFCQDLVNETIETSYIRINYFIKYLEAFVTLYQCKNFEEGNHGIKFVENLQRREIINQCMTFKDKDFETYCPAFCNEFSFNKENALIDGAFAGLMPYLEYFLKNRTYFSHQNSHVFYSNFGQIEKYLRDEIKNYQDDIYLKSVNGDIVVQTETQFTEGIQNYDQVKNNMFYISLSSIEIFAVGTLLGLIFNQPNDYNLKMKLVFFLSIFILQNAYVQQQEICKTEVLSKFGFRGLQFATNYEELVPYMPVNLCPNLTYSCCGQADFKFARDSWEEKRSNFKQYIRGVYKAIQQITVLQSSLLIFKSENMQNDNIYCKKVDFNFFTSPQKHEDIFEFIPDALRTFGFLQKGFYCMTCDANAQQFLSVKAPTQLMENIISEKFCSQMIFFFREFLIFKTFYLDTLYENVALLANCLHDKEQYTYKRPYETDMNSLKECLYKGTHCHNICKQFSIGHSGSLFLGKLSEYTSLIKLIKEILEMKKAQINKDEDQQGKIDIEYLEKLSDNFYQGKKHEENNPFENAKTNVRPVGLNLFEYSIMSNFYLQSFSAHDYLENFDNFEYKDYQNQKKEKRDEIEKKMMIQKNMKVHKDINNFKNIVKEETFSQQEDEEDHENKDKDPEFLNQKRLDFDEKENSFSQASQQQINQNFEVQRQEDLMHKEIDEKLRENSSFNIKQEIGSIKSKSAFILKCISFYVFFL